MTITKVTPALPHAVELNAILDEIAELEQTRDAIIPRIFCLRQRMKALRLYALTLPQAPQVKKEPPHAI